MFKFILKFVNIHKNERWIIYTERGSGDVGLVTQYNINYCDDI